MPRIRVALLVGLFWASAAQAQTPGEAFDAPVPTRVMPEQVIAGQETVMEMGESVTYDAPNTANGWRFWVSADYALAWIKGKVLPPLVTTSPPGTAQIAAGAPGIATTSTLIGNKEIAGEPRSLGKLDFGMWFNEERTFGVAAGFFISEAKGKTFGVASDGTNIIARPFFDATNGNASSILVSFPGVSAGSVNVYAGSQTFMGANFDLQESVLSESWVQIHSLFGYRYLHYSETLLMGQTVNPLGAAFVAGTSIVSNDSFLTANDFHGVEFGLRTEFLGERWSAELLTKLAVGNVRRVTIVRGTTITTVPGAATTTAAGGVYALPSNIGTFSTEAWVVAPELGLTFEYQVSSNIFVRLGYTFLFWEGISRAADQVDFHLNPNQFAPAIPGGPNLPQFSLNKADIWIQSVNVGVEFRY